MTYKEPRIIAPFAELHVETIAERMEREAQGHPGGKWVDPDAPGRWVGSGPDPEPNKQPQQPKQQSGFLDKIFKKKEAPQQDPIEQYTRALGAALQAKFPNAQIPGSGVLSIKGMVTDTVGISHVVSVGPDPSGTYDIKLDGQIRGYRVYPGVNKTTEVYNKPFIVSKTVFPGDDPAVVADWVFTETQRRIGPAERDMKARGTDKLPFPY